MPKKEKEEAEKDLEEEWKKLREKLKEKEAEEPGLEESVEHVGEAMSSGQFAQFLQSSGEAKAPVLERIQESVPENLEQVSGFESWRPEEPESITRTDEQKYIPTSEETPYSAGGQIQTRVDPPVLTPRDTMPQEEIPRHELLDPRQAISGRASTEDLYPKLLESEEKDKKEYYKVVK